MQLLQVAFFIYGGNMEYGLTKDTEYSFDEAVEKTIGALKEEGFGILTTIDMKETLKNKIGAEIDKYVILGACNPNFAYEALQEEYELGLLLPCNVIVYEKNGKVTVSIMNPEIMSSVTGNNKLMDFGREVKEILSRALNKI